MATFNFLRLAGSGCPAARVLFRQPTRSFSCLGPLRAVASSQSQLLPSNQVVQKRDYVSRTSTTIWMAERGMSVALLLALPLGIAFPGDMMLDLTIGALLPLHIHFGMHQVFLDYMHSHTGHRIVNIVLPLLTGAAILSFFYFNFTDIGLTKAFCQFWKAL